jgi:hypothetical protein
MDFAAFEGRTIRTRLGEITVAVPGDWKGEAVAESPFGEWLFDHPDGACTLYIQTELEVPSGRRPAEDEIVRRLLAQGVAHRFTYQDVSFSIDHADRGRLTRACYRDSDDQGEVWHDDRQRLVDAGERGIVSLRFQLIYDAALHGGEQTQRLCHDLGIQFDLATLQLMRPFGFDTEADPGLLWRESTLDMGNGNWTIRRPAGWTLSYGDGHEAGATLWSGMSPDERWDMRLERSLAASQAGRAAENRADLERRMLDTLPDILPLTAAPIIERAGDATIVAVQFRDTEWPLDLVRRWYVIREQDPFVQLFRIGFGCRSEDADSVPGLAMLRFFQDMADRTTTCTSEYLEVER